MMNDTLIPFSQLDFLKELSIINNTNNRTSEHVTLACSVWCGYPSTSIKGVACEAKLKIACECNTENGMVFQP